MIWKFIYIYFGGHTEVDEYGGPVSGVRDKYWDTVIDTDGILVMRWIDPHSRNSSYIQWAIYIRKDLLC